MFFKPLALVVLLSFLLSTAAFAQNQGPAVQPMTNEGSAAPMAVPQPAPPPHEALTFFGQWTLSFYNGSRVSMNGAVAIPYSEMHVTFNGGMKNSDGETQFYGVVDNAYGSSVTARYNSKVDGRYVQVFIYEPDYEFGTSNQYTSTELRVFLAPKGNDYLHGTMSAIQRSTDWNGNWVTRALYTGQVDIYRTPAPSGPMIGDAPVPTPTGSGGGKG